jgi:hypothetical protein
MDLADDHAATYGMRLREDGRLVTLKPGHPDLKDARLAKPRSANNVRYYDGRPDSKSAHPADLQRDKEAEHQPVVE